MPARRSCGTLAETTYHRRRKFTIKRRVLQGAACKPLFVLVNYLLTITPQHWPSIKSPRALAQRRKLIVHLGGEPRLVGLQGVASCRHLAYDTTSACFPNSSRRFSARLVWVSRLRLQSSGFVPDRHAACLLTALGFDGREL